jgi:hypothetical protein
MDKTYNINNKINMAMTMDNTYNINNNKINDSKYGNDENFEPFLDNKLFFPIANLLVEPLHKSGLTPNMVTVISTVMTLLTIYFLHIDSKGLAVTSYLSGYILDCVDGKMARRYNQGSLFGMVLDNTSDTLSNFILLVYILYKYKLSHENVYILFLLFFIIIIFSFSYSLNEAILSYNKNNNDNFYKNKENELNGKWKNKVEEYLFKYYLSYHENLYSSYRDLFPQYDENKINQWLPILKEFGPGTFNFIAAYFIYKL